MPEINEEELKRHISGGSFSPVYVVAGEEKLLVKRLAKRLIQKAAGEAFPEFNRREFGSQVPVDDLADAVEALPFFAEHKCVSVSDFNVEERNETELSKLYQLLEDPPEGNTLVFWFPTLDFDGKKSAKWKKFLKQAGAKGDLLFCGRKSDQELRKLLIREAEKAGCVLSRDNAGKIIDHAGRDLTLLLGEINKLCSYALGLKEARGEEGEARITRDMIEELVAKTVETTAFLLANALTAGNYERAYRLLDELFYQNVEPIAILGALAASYVDMYRVRAALESGKPGSAPAEYGEYRGKEFRLQKAERSAKGVPQAVLRESVVLLLEADMTLKSSRLDPRVVLDQLIAKLLLSSERRKRA